MIEPLIDQLLMGMSRKNWKRVVAALAVLGLATALFLLLSRMPS